MTANPLSVTFLRAPEASLTKRFVKRKDGTLIVRPYDQAAHFEPKSQVVKDIRHLGSMLTTAAGRDEFCVIRGEFVGADEAARLERERLLRLADSTSDEDPEARRKLIETFGDKTLYRRRKIMFAETPRSWVCFDFDKYPVAADWRKNPAAAIEAAIIAELGPEFASTTCFYQFSASAGVKDGLCVHLWFLLDEPMGSADWRGWYEHRKAVLGRRPAVDRAMFRTVQIHYTASPFFKGMPDPLVEADVTRTGFLEGLVGDTVPALPKAEIKIAVGSEYVEEWDDAEDGPRQRPGIVGAFNRVFSIRRLIEEHLGHVFEVVDSKEGRVTYLLADSGAAGGCRIYDNVSLYNSHNSDPLEGKPGSAFDLIQAHMFDGDFRKAAEWADSFADVRRERLEAEGSEFTTADEGDGLVVVKPGRESAIVDLLADIERTLTIDSLKGAMMDQIRGVLAKHKIRKDENDWNAIKSCVHRQAGELNSDDFGLTAIDAEMRRETEASKEGSEERFTDRTDRLSHRVLETFFGGGAKLLHAGMSFWHYNGGAWRHIERPVIERYSYGIVRDDMFANDLIAKKGTKPANEVVSPIVDTLKYKTAQNMSVFGLDRIDRPNVINCKNVQLEVLKDGSVRPRDHDPGAYLRGQFPVVYDPAATCPGIDAMLTRIFGYLEDPLEIALAVDTLWELMGFTIQIDKRVPIWVLSQGPGKNGKSSIMWLLHNLLGNDFFLARPISDFGHNANHHIWASLVDKRVMVDDDVDENTMLPDGALKSMCESKVFTANPKFKDEFNFLCQVTPWLLANGYPRTNDLSKGMQRRVVVMPLLTAFDTPGAHLFSARDFGPDEISGALTKALAGYKRLVERGLEVDPPAAWVEAKAAWIRNSNDIAAFKHDRLARAADPEDLTPGAKVYDAYVNEMRGRGKRPLAKIDFYRKLEQVGVRTARGEDIGDSSRPNSTFVLGWTLKSGVDDDFVD